MIFSIIKGPELLTNSVPIVFSLDQRMEVMKMKIFFYGVLIEGIIGIVSIIMKDSGFFMKASGVIGFGSLIISGIISGFMSENIYRRTAVENAEERRSRLGWSGKIFTFSIPGIISFLASLYLRAKP